MSDAPHGPGWWLASDGRWYPPESRPVSLPPPPVPAPSGTRPVAGPPTVPPGHGLPTYPPIQQLPYPYAHVPHAPTSVSTGLGGTLQGFYWALAGLSIICAVLGLAALAMFDRYWDTPVNSRAEAEAFDDWAAVEDALSAFSGFAIMCGLVVLVLMIVWAHGAHGATSGLWRGDRTWSAGWTIGGWFIPIANLVIPKLVLGEIDRIACAPRSNGTVDGSWKSRATLAVGKVWWAGHVAAFVLIFVGMALSEDVSDTELRVGYVATSVGFLALAVSGVLGALYVRRLGRRLSPTGISESP